MKDRLIRNLLDIGKKHRILVYPTLAIVAVITAFSHMIYWGRGNGKKVVASVMIMTLLITQSVFLTSSANVADDSAISGTEGIASSTDATPDNTQSNDDMAVIDTGEEPAGYTVKLYHVNNNNEAYLVGVSDFDFGFVDNGNSTVTINVPSTAQAAAWRFGDYAGHFQINGISPDVIGSSYLGGTVTLPKNATNEYNLYFRATRVSYPIIIKGSNGMADYSFTYTLDNPIPGEISPEFTYTVGVADDYNAYVFGKNYTGIYYGDGNFYAPGSPITVTPGQEDVSVITFDFAWEGMVFPISYKACADTDTHIKVTGDTVKTADYRYDTDITLWGADKMNGWAGNDGYYLSGWTDEAGNIYGLEATYNSMSFAVPLADIKEPVNITGNTLTALWAYKDIVVNVSNNGEGSAAPTENGGILISGTYGDEINCVISAEYKKDGLDGDKFRYSISDDDKNMLATYGLNVTENSNGTNIVSYTISGVLSNVTDDAGVSANLAITDNNKPADISTSSHPITLVSKPKEVSLDITTVLNETANGKPSKTYDGTAGVYITPQASVLDAELGDSVYLTFDAVATLDNPNAGKDKTLTISNVALAGDKAGMYVLKGLGEDKKLTLENIAQVDPKSISVSVSLAEDNDSVVLFGESNPSYVISLDSSMLTANDRTKYDGLTTDAERMAFMKSYLGFSGFEVSRAIYSVEGKYTSTPVFAGEGNNYAVSATGLRQEFTVVRDDGDGYYDTIGNPMEPVGDYYKEFTIVPSNGYDKIRWIKDGEGDITEDMSKGQVEAMFTNEINLNTDMTNGEVKFQMLNSATGAITYPVDISGINIDTSGPELVGYSVSPEIKYFNEFGFGSYYHSQKIDGVDVESVALTFEYKVSDSKCDVIRYYFADESGNIKEEFSGEIKTVKDAVTGNYKGTVTIGTGASGQLIVYAVDSTGNASIQSKVKLNEVVEFIKSTENSSNYYEWMVENVISASDIVVTKLSGDSAATGIWNNGVNMSVSAIDEDSGVWKLEWNIINPLGETTTITDDINGGNGNVDSIVFATKYGKITQYNFNEALLGEQLVPGEYYIGATLYDNAGNSVGLTQKGPYLIDTKAPVISCGEYEGTIEGYISNVDLEFDVTEADTESGVASVKLYHNTESDDDLLGTWGDETSFVYKITENGTYIIVATDHAGNVSRHSVTFHKISNIIPNAPALSVDGVVGDNNWYIDEIPSVTISSQKFTIDGVPVTTYYRVTSGEKVTEKATDEETVVFDVTFEGEVKVEAWSKSSAGCVSDTSTLVIKVDTEAPDAYITEATVNNEGKPVINFKAQDDTSGINQDEIYVNGKKLEVLDDNGVISGSFVVESSKKYTILIKDMAGNVSDKLEFKPLSINAGAVTDITPDGANINAQIIEGTSPIAEARIEYKLATDAEYDMCLSNKTEEDYGLSLQYQFRNLSPDTVYDYRIYASTKGTKEVQIVEGSFRTADDDSTATVYGAAYYADTVPESYKTYPIYVGLYEANTIVAGTNIESPEDVKYEFQKVPNGTYRVVATNGLLTEVTYVTITEGGISYPTDYASNGGINLALDGLSTDVEIVDDVINISADGLDKIYNTALYNGNVTDDDLEVVAQGGTINITLHANYIDVSDLSQTTQTIFTSKIGTEGIIERYIQLYVIKEVRDADGNLVNDTPTNITRLAEPITVSFPLGDLAGQQIYVASLHGSDTSYKFINWGPGTDINILDESVVISTDRFSVYALYRLIEIPKEFSVKWIDGDGQVMKIETVREGDAAIPPTEIPTKQETSKYTYTFSGWDTDYSSINKDTIISAWFTVAEKEQPPVDKPTTEAPPSNNNDKPTTQAPTTEEPDISKEPVTYPYMGSGVSPQTGDQAPVLVMTMLMFMAGVGIAVLGLKKKKQN